MKAKSFLSCFLVTGAALYLLAAMSSGCAQIGAPTGGPRDSIAPRLVSSSPVLKATSVKGNKITLNFDEYVEVRDVQKNVLVSPYQKTTPTVDYKLKTVTVKFKDSLLPNTTYSINFGSAIVDNNEGNPLKNFTYVFSTGPQIDSFTLHGKVLLAETGGVDSAITALLYRNMSDSAVQKLPPDYMARLNGKGEFDFVNLPAGKFALYALKDGDGGKTYNSKVELFAFSNAPVNISAKTDPVLLYAYAEEKDKKTAVAAKLPNDKKLRYLASTAGQNQDLLKPFELSFNHPLKKADLSGVTITDTNYKPVAGAAFLLDTSRKIIRLNMKWPEQAIYRVIIKADALADSSGNMLAKSDTIKFVTKTAADYGRVVLRFSNIELAKHPVLQFVQGGEIKLSDPVLTKEWSNKFFPPGEYEIRILYDDNKNGQWDAGNYSKKLFPEIVKQLEQRLSVKADWDNELDITLN